MPAVWLTSGGGVPKKTLFDHEGQCSLQHLNLEKSSIALDDVHGCMDEGGGCRFNVTKFRAAISDPERGSSPDLAIVVTGKTGIQASVMPSGSCLAMHACELISPVPPLSLTFEVDLSFI